MSLTIATILVSILCLLRISLLVIFLVLTGSVRFGMGFLKSSTRLDLMANLDPASNPGSKTTKVQC